VSESYFYFFFHLIVTFVCFLVFVCAQKTFEKIEVMNNYIDLDGFVNMLQLISWDSQGTSYPPEEDKVYDG